VQKNGVNKGQPRAWINPFVALCFPFPGGREVEGEKLRETPLVYRGGVRVRGDGGGGQKTKTETLPLRTRSRFSALFVAGRKSRRRESRRAPPMAIFRALCRRLLPVPNFEASRLVSFGTSRVHLSVASLIQTKAWP